MSARSVQGHDLTILARLLDYPGAELLAGWPQLQAAASAELAAELQPMWQWLQSQSGYTVQAHYVALFDQNPSLSLHLFEHIHGESRDRGPAMVDLIEQYRKHGVAPTADELPDYLPLFLEFVATLDAATQQQWLGEAVHIVALLGQRLQAVEGPYAAVLQALQDRIDAQPLPLASKPVRDMEETLVRFDVDATGQEPLLSPPLPTAAQVVKFYSRRTMEA